MGVPVPFDVNGEALVNQQTKACNAISPAVRGASWSDTRTRTAAPRHVAGPGDERAVDRTDRRPDNELRHNARVDERSKLPRLHRAKIAALR